MAVAGFAIEGPSQAKIECEDQNDGSCDVKYWPTEPGEYAVHVMCDDEDIEESPFMAYIIPDNKSNNSDLVSRPSPSLFLETLSQWRRHSSVYSYRDLGRKVKNTKSSI